MISTSQGFEIENIALKSAGARTRPFHRLNLSYDLHFERHRFSDLHVTGSNPFKILHILRSKTIV